MVLGKIIGTLVATRKEPTLEGLKLLVKEKIKADPQSGHLFVFSNRTRTRIKMYQWDGTGEVITIKKIHRGTFRWQPTRHAPACRSRRRCWR